MNKYEVYKFRVDAKPTSNSYGIIIELLIYTYNDFNYEFIVALIVTYNCVRDHHIPSQGNFIHPKLM